MKKEKIELRKQQPERMSRGERNDLIQVVRMRAKIAREDVELHAAQQLADVEKQLAAQYKMNHAAFKDLSSEAEKKIKEVDEQIAARCREMGIPEQFRPEVNLWWHNRGENAVGKRREELRKVASAELDARVRSAKSKIYRSEAELLERLTAEGLDSSAAKEFLASLPTAEQLMPKLLLGDLEKKLPLLP